MIKVSEKTTDRGIEDINFCTVKNVIEVKSLLISKQFALT